MGVVGGCCWAQKVVGNRRERSGSEKDRDNDSDPVTLRTKDLCHRQEDALKRVHVGNSTEERSEGREDEVHDDIDHVGRFLQVVVEVKIHGNLNLNCKRESES